MSDPVSLFDIKAHLRLDPDDQSENDSLDALLLAARRACEVRIGRDVDDGAATLTLDRFPGGAARNWNPDSRRHHGVILVPGPVSEVTSITYRSTLGSTIEVDASDYVVDLTRDPARISPCRSWPATAWTAGAVTIAYVRSGLSETDTLVVAHAIRLVVGSWYANREAIPSARSAPGELPLAVSWLLEPLRSVPVPQP